MSRLTVPIAVVNQSTVLTSADVKAYVKAQQLQVSRDFFPYWDIDAHVVISKDVDHAPHGAWALVLLDDSDQADALGYHYETQDGQPLGKAFVKTDQSHGLSWTVTASHEMLEMLADPWTERLILTSGPTGHYARLWAYENADAVEADQYAYDVGGMLLSDFVLPDWFQPETTGKGPWDFGRHCAGPLQILPGGYMSVLDFAPMVPPEWHQVYGERVPSQRHSDIQESPRRLRRYEQTISVLEAVKV